MLKTSRRCWSCQTPIGITDTQCKNCSRIQPFPEGIDYFECMGLERLLRLDLQGLERRFYELSRQFHPDFHQGKDETEQNISLENSALLNKAYRTLRDLYSRVEYLLVLEEEGKSGIDAKVPQEFLEEIFELQEVLEEVRSTADPDLHGRNRHKLQEALKVLENRLSDLDKRLFDLFGQWDQTIHDRKSEAQPWEKKPLLQQMREILSHRTYLTNMIQDVQHLLQGHTERREIRH